MRHSPDEMGDPNAHDWQAENLMARHEFMRALLSNIGGAQSPIDPMEHTAAFVEHYALTVDGVPFDLTDRYKHLRELYEDVHRFIVVMAGAQTGKSGFLLAFLLRLMAGPAWGKLVGYYFPDKHLPAAFSRDRFKPFIRSNPALAKHLGAAQAIRGGKGTDSVLTMTWGECVLYWMTIGGKTATEGLPLFAVVFDEVRRMEHSDIERAQERYSAQENPYDLKVSTARLPETDIEHWFLRGDQRYFHTACGCPEGIVLSQRFPDCILDLRQSTPLMKRKVAHAFEHAGRPYLGMTDEQIAQFYEAAYWCPTCGEVITDPREGWWEPHAPRNWVHSYQLPQMLSWTYPAGRFLHKFDTAEDLQEFYNSGLGRGYVDREKMPTQLSHCLACVDPELVWGEHMTTEQRGRRCVNTGMGIDVQAGYLVAVIKTATPSGKHRTLHVEVSTHESANPWKRAAELMQRYDVRCCIVDYMPDMTGSMNFARAFMGRVFLQGYWLSHSSKANVAWGEHARAKEQRGNLKFKHWVSMKRAAVLHWNCMRWVHRANELPDPSRLMQTLPVQEGKVILSAHLRGGLKQPMPVALDPYLDHQTRWVFQAAVDVEGADGKAKERKKRLGKGEERVAEWVGKDPHFSHADTWASIAVAKHEGTARLRRLDQEAP